MLLRKLLGFVTPAHDISLKVLKVAEDEVSWVVVSVSFLYSRTTDQQLVMII